MRKPLKIGQKEYKFKKDAIAHYRAILNSYDFNQSLNPTDFDDLIDLLDYDYLNYLAESEISDVQSNGIIDTRSEVENDENIEDELIIE